MNVWTRVEVGKVSSIYILCTYMRFLCPLAYRLGLLTFLVCGRLDSQRSGRLDLT